MSRLLCTPWMFYVGTLALTSVFWWSGISKLASFAQAQEEMAHFGLNPPAMFAAATILLQLGGSALVVWGGRLAWLGAAALAAFTLATIPLAHDYWNMTGHVTFLEKTLAQEHLSVVGGLVVAAILGHLRQDGRAANRAA
jgi:transmembrane protein